MLIFDETITWQAQGTAESRCRIRVVKLNNSGTVTQLKNYYIVASDMGKSSETSITNSAPFLIPMVCREQNIGLGEMVWFEHYPRNESRGLPTLDVVTPGQSKSCCGAACSQMISVDWRPARANEIEHLKQFIPDIVSPE